MTGGGPQADAQALGAYADRRLMVCFRGGCDVQGVILAVAGLVLAVLFGLIDVLIQTA
ncbi:MAG: hypothetical protein IT449_04415 [Phycisphaerales bacterium]|nr:hypothetical protein [Phycisphaerales bacterium]